MIDETYTDGWDNSFLTASWYFSKLWDDSFGRLGTRLVAPLEPNKFDNASSKAKEIGIRTLLALGAAIAASFYGFYIGFTAVVLTAGSKLLRAIGFHIQQNNFTHIKGIDPKPLQNNQLKILTQNWRSEKSYDHGLIHWSSRIDRLLEKVQKQDPDVIVLQEIFDTGFFNQIVNSLEDRYANFYGLSGAHVMGKTSGCLVITKCAVKDFSHIDFTTHEKDTNRGFSSFKIFANPQDKTPLAHIIATQLSANADADEQMDQIEKFIRKDNTGLPTFFVGGGKADAKCLAPSSTKETHTDQLAKQWAKFGEPEASRNVIAQVKRGTGKDTLPVSMTKVIGVITQFVEAFDSTFNTQTALADNHASVATFQLAQ